MQAFHVPGPAPLYTNSYLLISDAGHGVIIDPAAEPEQYTKLLQEHSASLTAILCTHGHYDHVGSAQELCRSTGAKLYCEAADLRNDQLYPLSQADSGYEEGAAVTVDELAFMVWHTPAIPRAAWCCNAADICLPAIRCFRAAWAVQICPAAARRR